MTKAATPAKRAKAASRETVLRALRKKPEGLTSAELHAQFPRTGCDDMDEIIQGLYDEGLLGLDTMSERGRARWVAA
ncbi:hypothetical protein [Streptomyces sp. CCM_MD2014]|uniref:hypothetical protein n=1 Tax=Streptomyces sp. CCM_MD2014 TaxID=1561022 RepID=UPI00052AD50D|nr:hypothetical protein [Streptomyces sp. CCM_MD2014]AIV36415.1 hypothetical protein NI25_25500 [Streptomyces sp. CCM_MD2014]